ncbi:MAG TPA: hypothetical protein VJ784_11430 [Pyrinomonadaceae bacterium]|nr:hypothetical protein [Pyrinomonadaceae bacterium]
MITLIYPSTRTILLLFAALLINTWAANAQTSSSSGSTEKVASNPNNAAAPQNQSEQPKPAPTPFPLSVKDVIVNGASAGLNDTITIIVENLDKEIERQKKQEPPIPLEQQLDPSKYVLFLDDIEMKKLHPTLGPNRELHFQLRRNVDTQDAWLNFLGHPSDSTKPVTASVGMEGKPPIPGKSFTLRLYNRKLLYVASVLFIAALIGFIVAACYTTIIRDSGPPTPDGGPLKRPFSLGRAQMAWWFFIILGSFLFIALVTWDVNTISSSSLVLMGIGAGTALGAAMVDANKRQNSNSDLNTLKPKEAQLEASITDLKSKIAEANLPTADETLKTNLAAWEIDLATKVEELRQVKSQLQDAISEQQRPVTAGPILDFLTDANGVTFHRFQMLVWTIVLGLFFLYSVWASLSMPQFSDTLLALMGISAGTYIGFKIPEKQTDAADAAAAAKAGAGK